MRDGLGIERRGRRTYGMNTMFAQIERTVRRRALVALIINASCAHRRIGVDALTTMDAIRIQVDNQESIRILKHALGISSQDLARQACNGFKDLIFRLLNF